MQNNRMNSTLTRIMTEHPRPNTGLLQDLAEAGGGSYAFIPDAGMVGTAFVHALALQPVPIIARLS